MSIYDYKFLTSKSIEAKPEIGKEEDLRALRISKIVWKDCIPLKNVKEEVKPKENSSRNRGLLGNIVFCLLEKLGCNSEYMLRILFDRF